MKILIFILVFAITASAQIKCKLVEDKVDDFTGKLHRVTDFVQIGKLPGLVKFKAKILAVDSTASLFLTLNAPVGCMSSKSECLIKFQDGELLTLPYRGKVQCGEFVMFYALINRDYYDKIKSTQISKIRYRGDTYEDIDITEPWFLKDLLQCVGVKAMQ